MAISFSEAISRAPLKRYSIATFAVCMLVLICDGMDVQLLGIVAPVVIEEFGIDRGTFGVAMGAALVGFGIGSWGGGWLGDTMGRRWSLVLATILFSLATVGASWSGDVWQMAAWRLLGGIGFGSAYTNAIALAGEWLPERWRAVGVTTLSVGTPAGGLVVAALTPTLVESFGWRGTFIFIGIATFLVVGLILLVLRDSPSFLLAHGKKEEAHRVAGRVIDGAITLVPEPEPAGGAGGRGGVFAPGNFRLNLGVGMAFAAATLVAYGILNWSTTFLTAKGFSFEDASYAVSVAGLTSIAASIASGLFVRRIGSRALMLGTGSALILTLLALAFVLETLVSAPDGSQQLVIVALIGLAAALFSAAIASFYALMTYAYPPSCRSAGIGFGIFVGRIGAIAASGFGGALIDLGEGSLVPFFTVLGASAALIAGSALLIDRHILPAAHSAPMPAVQ